ncbi:hypothetical protein ABW19_dt0210560 [Dactylella cylindrospora]|nr:hypothetical protein ABW19_dt0210560 [Dactylella cylindrospora]
MDYEVRPTPWEHEGIRRSTRSLTRKAKESASTEAGNEAEELAVATSQVVLSHPPIILLPPASSLTTKLTGLPKKDLSLLQQKQRLLQASTPLNLEMLLDTHLKNSLSATLVFAQSEAGTAFCISSTGMLVTCSHCVSENEEDLEGNRIKWLMFASGRVVKAKCIAYDSKRDLALLQIVAAEGASPTTTSLPKSQETSWTSFPFMTISNTPPAKNAPMICIGHPGSEDLEAFKPGKKTGYDVIHVSFGRFRGISPKADVQDNSEIGALMHDCWTYWGHSGAPLCLRKDGRLVGVHSSWDDETGMRRGVAWEAMVDFLREQGELGGFGESVNEGSVEKPIVLE